MAFMFDPAIPTEALLPKAFVSNDAHIEPAAWRAYPEEIKASEWHGLFPAGDARSELTWRGLVHAAAPKLKIFFSEGGMTKTFPFDILDTPESMARLKTDPVFGITTPTNCAGLFHETNGHDVADDPAKFRTILADMIPERTLPAGGAGGSGVAADNIETLEQKFAASQAGTIQVFDMQANRNGWRHSDMREVAYVYVWKAWQEIVNDGELHLEPQPNN